VSERKRLILLELRMENDCYEAEGFCSRCGYTHVAKVSFDVAGVHEADAVLGMLACSMEEGAEHDCIQVH
jgi:hypothetical protein